MFGSCQACISDVFRFALRFLLDVILQAFALAAFEIAAFAFAAATIAPLAALAVGTFAGLFALLVALCIVKDLLGEPGAVDLPTLDKGSHQLK